MQSLKKPPSGGFFYFRRCKTQSFAYEIKNQAKKKHLLIQVLCELTLLGLNSINQLLQIHIQLHAAQGAAVARGAATVTHTTQGGGLKLVFRHFQAKKQIGVFVAFFTA